MSEDSYEPTTEEILAGYAESERGDGFMVDPDFSEREARKDADRWHAAEIRRAKAEALRAARIELGTLAHCINVTPWELLDTLDARIKRFEARDD